MSEVLELIGALVVLFLIIIAFVFAGSVGVLLALKLFGIL